MAEITTLEVTGQQYMELLEEKEIVEDICKFLLKEMVAKDIILEAKDDELEILRTLLFGKGEESEGEELNDPMPISDWMVLSGLKKKES